MFILLEDIRVYLGMNLILHSDLFTKGWVIKNSLQLFYGVIKSLWCPSSMLPIGQVFRLSNRVAILCNFKQLSSQKKDISYLELNFVPC